jgi:long-chain acyl-CoA synthetase
MKAIAGIAPRLQKFGAAGERVAVLMTNCLEMPISILGAMAAHAYVAPMNPNYSDRELEPLLKDASPKVIVTLPQFHARVSRFAENLGVPHVLVAGEAGDTVEQWIEEGREGLPQPLPQSEDHAMMFFTGGTTGLPKGAEHRHRHIMAFCRLEAAILSTAEYDKEIPVGGADVSHFGITTVSFIPFIWGRPSARAPVQAGHRSRSIVSLQVTLFAGGPRPCMSDCLPRKA